MKSIFLGFIFLFTLCKLSAKEITWYKGSVVLETRKVLVGEISIEVDHDLILLRSNGKVDVYPAHKIRSLQFYDEQENINRKFVSLPEKQFIRNVFRLFEVVVSGDVAVLRKKRSVCNGTLSDADDFHYYVLYNQELSQLTSFRSKVYPTLMLNGGSEFADFILKKDLTPNDPAGAIQIIESYNQLVRNDQLIARTAH